MSKMKKIAQEYTIHTDTLLIFQSGTVEYSKHDNVVL